jgi:chaperone modulatory protein CbpM
MTTGLLRMTVAELCECEGVSLSVVTTLVEHDIAHPVTGARAEDWEFDATDAAWVKKAIRLHRDLDIDWLAVASLVDLIRERDRLARENDVLRQRLQRFIDQL